jgi:hypothetical protein
MWRLVLLSFGILTLFGCSGGKKPNGVVSGKLTYKGNPVNGAALQLIQATGAGESYRFPTTQEGAFHISDVPAGEYKVVVQPSPGYTPNTKGMDPAVLAENRSKMEEMKTPGTIPIPDKYKQRTTTDLTLTVTKEDQTVNLELKD